MLIIWFPEIKIQTLPIRNEPQTRLTKTAKYTDWRLLGQLTYCPSHVNNEVEGQVGVVGKSS